MRHVSVGLGLGFFYYDHDECALYFGDLLGDVEAT